MDSLKFITGEMLMNNQSPCSTGSCPSPTAELNSVAGRKWYRKAAHRYVIYH